MGNISKKDISYRLDKIKETVANINEQIMRNNNELVQKYSFAKELGINYDTEYDTESVISNLNQYIEKADNIIAEINNSSENKVVEEKIKALNNILYLDDIKLDNIKDLVEENRDIRLREYVDKIADKANTLIRNEEIKNIDNKIKLLSKKSNILEKLSGKDKTKRLLLENYSLKKVETINKKYIPRDKSILEIVNIVNNCGYKTNEMSEFIKKITKEYKLGDLLETALTVPNSEVKIPFFYNKEFADKISKENIAMVSRINGKKKIARMQDYNPYTETIKEGISTLELFNFNNSMGEVI